MRYPDNFKQDISEQDLRALPPLCEYTGKAPDLQHLVGKLIPTLDVQKLVYVGERESISVEHTDGERRHPWKHVWITEFGPDGEPVFDPPPHRPLPEPEDPAEVMGVSELAMRGFTDADLSNLAQEHLGETWEPGGPGTSRRRKALFGRVMGVLGT